MKPETVKSWGDLMKYKVELEAPHKDSVADVFDQMTMKQKMLVFKASGLTKEDFQNGYREMDISKRSRIYAGLKELESIVLMYTSLGILNLVYFRLSQNPPLRAATHSELEQAEQTKAINAHRRRYELEQERQAMEQDDHEPIVKPDYKQAVNA